MADNLDIQPPPQEPSPIPHGGYPGQAPQVHPQGLQGPGPPYSTAPGQGSPYGWQGAPPPGSVPLGHAPGGGAPAQDGAPQAGAHAPGSPASGVGGGGPVMPPQ